MNRWTVYLLNLFYPRKCPLCGTLTEGSTPHLCPACAAAAEEELSLPCPLCGKTADFCTCVPSALRGIGDGVGKRIHLCTGFYRTGEADAPLARLMYTLKRSADDTAAQIAAAMLSRALLRQFRLADEDIRTWCITYPPRTAEAYRRTGVDQAQRIARFCAERTGASYAKLIVRRGGLEQKTLSQEERTQNAAASLALKHPERCAGKRILLIDDIVTTGSTLAACAHLLREAGAEAVFCASVLKTVPSKYPKKQPAMTDKPLWFQNI